MTKDRKNKATPTALGCLETAFLPKDLKLVENSDALCSVAIDLENICARLEETRQYPHVFDKPGNLTVSIDNLGVLLEEFRDNIVAELRTRAPNDVQSKDFRTVTILRHMMDRCEVLGFEIGPHNTGVYYGDVDIPEAAE